MSIALNSSEETLHFTGKIVGYSRTPTSVPDVVFGDVRLLSADGKLVGEIPRMRVSLSREWLDKVENPYYQGPYSQIGLDLVRAGAETTDGQAPYNISRIVRMAGLSR